MPILLEPDKKFQIVLECDKHHPAESRPTFFAQSKSMRDAEAMSEEFDRIFEMDTSKEIFDHVCDMLQKHIVSFKNMGDRSMPTKPEEWKDLLTFEEAKELLRLVMRNQRVQEEEKKG